MAEISRRTFVGGAASAGILASGVLAQTSRSNAKLRFGIIGTGHRGGIHINAIKSFDECPIIAACDVMENHLHAAMNKIGPGAQSYTDYQKLLSNPDIDAVLIATPNCLHHEMVLAALQAKKHVMCEKPMAITLDECHAMKAAAARSDRCVLYTMQLRYSPRFKTIRDLIEKGKIGKPRHLLFVEYRGDWNRGDVWKFNDPKQGLVNWRFSHAATGGTLNEKVCHYFDILHWMVDETPATISGTGAIGKYNDGRDTWDHATTTITYPSGARATHDLCMFGHKRFDFQIVGDEASIHMSDASPSLLLESAKSQEEIATPPEVAHGERGPAKGQETAVLLMYKDFLECIAGNKKPWMDADKAMRSSKTAWLGELSNNQKREVKWDEIS